MGRRGRGERPPGSPGRGKPFGPREGEEGEEGGGRGEGPPGGGEGEEAEEEGGGKWPVAPSSGGVFDDFAKFIIEDIYNIYID
jgi:hypothetical protein